MKLELTDDAGALSGTMTTTGSACLTSNAIKGSVSGSTITFRVDESGKGVTASYTGTVSGSEMSGTMTVTCPAGTGKGTWKVTKA